MKLSVTKKISNTFNEYFTNITKGLICMNQQEIEILTMKKAVKRQKKHFGNKNFSFETVSKKDVLSLIQVLPGNKGTVSNDIPVSVLQESISDYYKKLTEI